MFRKNVCGSHSGSAAFSCKVCILCIFCILTMFFCTMFAGCEKKLFSSGNSPTQNKAVRLYTSSLDQFKQTKSALVNITMNKWLTLENQTVEINQEALFQYNLDDRPHMVKTSDTNYLVALEDLDRQPEVIQKLVQQFGEEGMHSVTLEKKEAGVQLDALYTLFSKAYMAYTGNPDAVTLDCIDGEDGSAQLIFDFAGMLLPIDQYPFDQTDDEESAQEISSAMYATVDRNGRLLQMRLENVCQNEQGEAYDALYYIIEFQYENNSNSRYF